MLYMLCTLAVVYIEKASHSFFVVRATALLFTAHSATIANSVSIMFLQAFSFI